MMVVGYLIPGEGWYATDAPDGATDEEIEASILADINQDAYSPYGATLDIRWESSDGRSGRLEHTIEPDVDELMRRRGIDQCRESDDGEHAWEPYGGCDGVYAVGGTAIEVHDRCSHCGLVLVEHRTGPQRLPGEPEISVRFGGGQ
jgi:hypothetical protein